MQTVLYVLSALVLFAAIYFVLVRIIRLYLRYKGTRLVTCPENETTAAVSIDAIPAALSNLTAPILRLRECSRWPEREDCGQQCLKQIEAAPEGCLLRNIVNEWYADKPCAVCGEAIGEISWAEHQPALLRPDRKTVQWTEIRPEAIPETLKTHRPLCWDCHIALTFRRKFPHLVTDRNH